MECRQSMRLKWKQQPICTAVLANVPVGCGASGEAFEK